MNFLPFGQPFVDPGPEKGDKKEPLDTIWILEKSNGKDITLKGLEGKFIISEATKQGVLVSPEITQKEKAGKERIVSKIPANPFQGTNQGVFIGYEGKLAENVRFVQFVKVEIEAVVKDGEKYKFVPFTAEIAVPPTEQKNKGDSGKFYLDSLYGNTPYYYDPAKAPKTSAGAVDKKQSWMFDAPNVASALLNDEDQVLEKAVKEKYGKDFLGIRITANFYVYAVDISGGKNKILGYTEWKSESYMLTPEGQKLITKEDWEKKFPGQSRADLYSYVLEPTNKKDAYKHLDAFNKILKDTFPKDKKYHDLTP
jgi:hypothetical protein